jgi:hypothetical protein
MAKRRNVMTVAGRGALRALERNKQSWRDQVVFDCRLSGMTKAVAYGMARWITESRVCELFLRTGDIIVSGRQRELADMVGCSTKTVHLAMASLIDHGHMTLIRRPQGRDDTNLYRIISGACTSSDGLAWKAPENSEIGKLATPQLAARRVSEARSASV